MSLNRKWISLAVCAMVLAGAACGVEDGGGAAVSDVPARLPAPGPPDSTPGNPAPGPPDGLPEHVQDRVAELRAAAGLGIWKTADDKSGKSILVPGFVPPGLNGGELSFNPPRGRLTSEDNIDPETEEPVSSSVPMTYSYHGTIGDPEDGRFHHVLQISVYEITDERRDQEIALRDQAGYEQVQLGSDIVGWLTPDARQCPEPDEYHDDTVLSWYDGNVYATIAVLPTVSCEGDPIDVDDVLDMAEHLVTCSFERNNCARRYVKK